jgi:site-specific DNA-cytosine methylase
VDHSEDIRIISLCSGSLGLERGIERAIGKCRTICYVEREAFPVFNLVAAMEANVVAPAPIWTDVKTFDGKPFRNKVHIIAGGYPCQGESSAGKRLLENDPRFLWPDFRRIIKETNPVCCYFENVGTHLSGTFKYVLADLREMGYTVEAGLFSASEVGAPHVRQRVFILAHSNIEFMRRCMANARGKQRDLQRLARGSHEVTIAKGSKDVANANGIGKGSMPIGDEQKISHAGSGSIDMGDSQGEGLQAGSEERDSLFFKEGQAGQAGSERPGADGLVKGISVGNSDDDGRTASKVAIGSKEGSYGIKEGKDGQGKFARSGHIGILATQRWPAGPGQPQYGWESPRTLKKGKRGKRGTRPATQSGMGCRINGYDFRADLLRMYGNSVVEESAQLGFWTLLEQHIKNYEICQKR